MLMTKKMVGLSIFFCFLFNSCMNFAEDEIYVLPNDFEGPVIVLFEESEGIPEKYNDGGAKVYEVPDSGILKAQFKKEEGFRNVVYKRRNGNVLRYLWPTDSIWDNLYNNQANDSIYVYGAAHARDSWFIVGRAADKERWSKAMAKKWESYSETRVLKAGESAGKMPEDSKLNKN